MLTQSDFDGIAQAVVNALHAAPSDAAPPGACVRCGKPLAVNPCAAVGSPVHACPACDKAQLDADRAAALAAAAPKDVTP